MDRRSFLIGSGASLMATLAASGVSFARAPTENRFVFVFLRGGLDGLHALAPYADADYRRLRPRLALERDALIDLDGYFGLHRSLGPLEPLWRRGELALVPAAATQYRDRSHFDGQNMLENGAGHPFGADDGWLNRAIAGLNGGDRRLGLSLGPNVPLILQGEADVQSWSHDSLPDASADFLRQVQAIYQQDRLFADAFHDAQGALDPDIDMSGMRGGDIGNDVNFPIAAAAAADLLAQPEGPRIAAMDLSGWDTHLNQPFRLRRLLGFLAEGLLALRDGLGPDWARTVVLVGSEFGRTAQENGSQGTDHGTGGLAILAGGAVSGGIHGRWPGLTPQSLFEGRDVQALNPYEGIFKSVLTAHLGLDAGYVEDRVFPNSRALSPMRGVLRAL